MAKLRCEPIGPRDQWDMRQPWWDWMPFEPAEALVLYDDEDRPLSCVRLFNRALVCGQAYIPAKGIGGVYTNPEHRSKGYARAAVSTAIRNGTSPVYVLHASQGGLYEKLGFKEINKDLWVRSELGAVLLLPGDWHLEPDWKF